MLLPLLLLFRFVLSAISPSSSSLFFFSKEEEEEEEANAFDLRRDFSLLKPFSFFRRSDETRLSRKRRRDDDTKRAFI